MIKTCKDRCQDTYQPPPRLGAGRLLVCWRMVWPAVVDGWRLMLQAGGCWPFWAPERQGGRAAAGGGAGCGCQGGGVMVCRWWLGGGDPAAICGGNSAVFNQPLTTFLVVAMVWRLTVFFLCSYWQFRRLLGRFRSPGAGRGLADGLGGLRVGGMGAVGCQNRKGEG